MPVLVERGPAYKCQFCDAGDWEDRKECQTHEAGCYKNPKVKKLRKSNVGKCYIVGPESTQMMGRITGYNDQNDEYIYEFFTYGCLGMEYTKDKSGLRPFRGYTLEEVPLERYKEFIQKCIGSIPEEYREVKKDA